MVPILGRGQGPDPMVIDTPRPLADAFARTSQRTLGIAGISIPMDRLGPRQAGSDDHGVDFFAVGGADDVSLVRYSRPRIFT